MRSIILFHVQALLLSELRRLTPAERKSVVDCWSGFLPAFALADTPGQSAALDASSAAAAVTPAFGAGSDEDASMAGGAGAGGNLLDEETV